MTTLRKLVAVFTALTLTACTVDFGGGGIFPSPDGDEATPGGGAPGTPDGTGPSDPEPCRVDPGDASCIDAQCSVDTDSDGLGVCEEARLGTNPDVADTDGDGLSDFEEARAGTNPLLEDTDGDGLSDERELYFGFDPTMPDTLGDGIEDGDRFIVRACDEAMPRSVNLHTSRRGDWALALPEAFSSYTTLSTADQGQIQELAIFAAPDEEVFGFVLSDPLDELGPFERLLTEIAALKTLGALVQELTEGEFDTHDRFRAAPGEYVIETEMMSASTMRDDVLLALTGLEREDITTLPAPSARQYASFTVKLAVVEREDRFVIVGALAPTSRFGDDQTRILLSDVTNTTNLATAHSVLVPKCYPYSVSVRVPALDVYLVVDQTAAADPYREDIERFVRSLYTHLDPDYIDARVAVTNMDAQRAGALRQQVGWHDDMTTTLDELRALTSGCSGCDRARAYGLFAAREGIESMRVDTAPASQRTRPYAQQLTVFLSPGDPESYVSGELPGRPKQDVAQVRADYRYFFARHTVAYALRGAPDTGCGTGGDGYEHIAHRSGGEAASLCADDFRFTTIHMTSFATGHISSVSRLPQTPVSASATLTISDDGRTGRSISRSRTHGFDYLPQTNSIAFFGDERVASRQTRRVVASYFVFEERPRK